MRRPASRWRLRAAFLAIVLLATPASGASWAATSTVEAPRSELRRLLLAYPLGETGLGGDDAVVALGHGDHRIGLHVARDLAQQQGGYLRTRDVEGVGATFVLGLPLEDTDDTDGTDGTDGHRRHRRPTERLGSHQSSL